MQRVEDNLLYDSETARCIWEGTNGGTHTAIYWTRNGRWFTTSDFTREDGTAYHDFDALTELEAGDTLAYHAGVAFARTFFTIGDA